MDGMAVGGLWKILAKERVKRTSSEEKRTPADHTRPWPSDFPLVLGFFFRSLAIRIFKLITPRIVVIHKSSRAGTTEDG